MYTLKASSSGTKFRPSDLLHEGLRGQRPDAAHRLRGKAGVGVRYQAQANVWASSGVRGKAQARECGAWRWRRTGRRRAPGAPRQRFG